MPGHLFQTFFAAEALELALFGLAQSGHAAGTSEAAEAALGNGFGELLEHLEGLQQTVHIRHLQAAAGGNALLRLALRMEGFSRSRGVMDWMMARVRPSCFSSRLAASSCLPMSPGSIPAI